MVVVNKARNEQIAVLESKIGYVFNKKYIINRALTHSSYANQSGLPYIEHNERLEFLGDSVLSLVVSEFIFKKFKSKPEGKLTKIRANMVCESSLFERAKKINLGDFILMGKGEEITGGRERVSILADAYEALIAAIYIDGGIEPVRDFIISNLCGSMENDNAGTDDKDYKSRLQEHVQREQGISIKYEIESEEGPAHNKVFFAKVSLNDREVGKGRGRSKKEAEQEAAKSALIVLGGTD